MRLLKRRSWEERASIEELLAEIAQLAARNSERPDPGTERKLLRLRHLAGIRVIESDHAEPQYPEPDFDALPAATASGPPEIARDDVTPELLRAGILRDGCLLVRGLVDRDDALAFAAEIDRVFAACDDVRAGGPGADGYYEEFEPENLTMSMAVRPWVRDGGGVLAADAPRVAAQLHELLAKANLDSLVGSYLGEWPLISVQKTTLRKAEPSVPGAWHQDGTFLGEVRALNLWLSLSRCGDEAPGLDIIPRRLNELAVDVENRITEIDISQAKAEAVAGDTPIVRPIFEPGDALLFDELFLHQTASDPSMPKPRFAIESWFFGESAFPADYAPIAVA